MWKRPAIGWLIGTQNNTIHSHHSHSEATNIIISTRSGTPRVFPNLAFNKPFFHLSNRMRSKTKYTISNQHQCFWCKLKSSFFNKLIIGYLCHFTQHSKMGRKPWTYHQRNSRGKVCVKFILLVYMYLNTKGNAKYTS